MGRPFEIVSDTEEFESFHLLHSGPIDADKGVFPLLFPDQLLCFVDVEGNFSFLAPLRQSPHLLPSGCLIIVGNQAYYCCVICKLDY